jgi:hypothetical protein
VFILHRKGEYLGAEVVSTEPSNRLVAKNKLVYSRKDLDAKNFWNITKIEVAAKNNEIPLHTSP